MVNTEKKSSHDKYLWGWEDGWKSGVKDALRMLNDVVDGMEEGVSVDRDMLSREIHKIIREFNSI